MVFKFRKTTVRNPEDAELIKFFQYIAWARLQDSRLNLCYHVANERVCSVGAGKKLKSKGVRAGVPDITINIPSYPYHGMFIELKYGKNALSEAQAEFGKLAKIQGYQFKVCYSADDAIAELNNYLKADKL
jgi:hypothetical protein